MTDTAPSQAQAEPQTHTASPKAVDVLEKHVPVKVMEAGTLLSSWVASSFAFAEEKILPSSVSVTTRKVTEKILSHADVVVVKAEKVVLETTSAAKEAAGPSGVVSVDGVLSITAAGVDALLPSAGGPEEAMASHNAGGAPKTKVQRVVGIATTAATRATAVVKTKATEIVPVNVQEAAALVMKPREGVVVAKELAAKYSNQAKELGAEKRDLLLAELAALQASAKESIATAQAVVERRVSEAQANERYQDTLSTVSSYVEKVVPKPTEAEAAAPAPEGESTGEATSSPAAASPSAATPTPAVGLIDRAAQGVWTILTAVLTTFFVGDLLARDCAAGASDAAAPALASVREHFDLLRKRVEAALSTARAEEDVLASVQALGREIRSVLAELAEAAQGTAQSSRASELLSALLANATATGILSVVTELRSRVSSLVNMETAVVPAGAVAADSAEAEATAASEATVSESEVEVADLD